MIYGIKWQDSKKSLKEYPKHIQSEILEQGVVELYFDNIFTALKVANMKQKGCNNLIKCSIFKLSKEQIKDIDPQNIVSTVEQYNEIMTTRVEQKVQDLVDMLPDR